MPGGAFCDPHDHCPEPIRGIRSGAVAEDRVGDARCKPAQGFQHISDATRGERLIVRRAVLLWPLKGSAADQAYLDVGRDAQPG